VKPIDPPPKPVRGQKFWVQTGTHWSMGENYTVCTVNSRSFYVSHHGRRDRFLLVEWTHWLVQRFAEGLVRLEWQPVQPPPTLPNPGAQPMADIQIDIRARDQRFLRAATSVLRDYTLTRTEDDERVRFAIKGGAAPYEVVVSQLWDVPPSCTCPDASHRAQEHNAGFCKHIIAVLIDNEDLRCQLLDVIL